MRSTYIIYLLALLGCLTACQQNEILQPENPSQQAISSTSSNDDLSPTFLPQNPLKTYAGTTDAALSEAKSTWKLVQNWSVSTEKEGWERLYRVNKDDLNRREYRLIVSTRQYQGDLYAYAARPFRQFKAIGLDPAQRYSVIYTQDDLQADETDLFAYAYTWTAGTQYDVSLYERPTTVIAPNTNDYPYADQLANCQATRCTADDYDFCQHSSASWVAWKVNQTYRNANGQPVLRKNVNGITLEEAKDWDTRLTDAGWTVSNTPKAGSIAQWEANPAFPNGHLAFVHTVSASGDLLISEYNTPNSPCTYSTRVIRLGSRNYPSNFIQVP